MQIVYSCGFAVIDMKNRGLFLLLLLLSVLSSPIQAATCTSQASGNWGQAVNWWCGGWFGSARVPVAGDTAIVNHAINLNTDTENLSGLEVATGASITSSGNRTIFLNGPLTNNGTITLMSGSSGRLSLLANDSIWRGAGQLSADHLDLNNRRIILDTSATLTIHLSNASPIQNNGGFNNGASPNRIATLWLDGAAQTLSQASAVYPNVVVSGGTKTVPAAGALTILGNLTIDAGGSFVSSDAVNLGGNLTINGGLTPGDGRWTFNGVTMQSISAAAAFRSVALNNAQGLSLGGNLTISDSSWGDLTLTAGRIATNSFSVVITRSCDAPWLALRVAGAWIYGNLQLTAPPYGATCLFPVGDANNYAPITLTYPWNAAPLGGAITGSTSAGDNPDTISGTSGIVASKSVNRWWTLTPSGSATFYSYDATFQYCTTVSGPDCGVNDVDAAATAANFIVARKTGSTWTSITPTAPSASSRKVSAQTAFGAFAIGEASPPPLTCVNDSFASGLNSAMWNVAGTGYTPAVVTSPTVPSPRLRLTDNNSNRATYAQLKRWFPGANNKVVVEFDYYVYGGSGADGIAVTFSDASQSPSPGGYGGSLGYANRSGINGFNGGWLGIGLDEFGNYTNSTEGRRGYPTGYTPPVGAAVAAGFYAQSVAVRGSGSGQTSGYNLLANSGVVSPALTTTSAVPQRYRITMDHSNSVNAWVSVQRDTGSGYTTVVPSFDVKKANSGQAAVPANMLLSFTGSTGGSTNFHEISNVQVCATSMLPVGGSTAAANFECLETGTVSTWSSTARHPLYTKITDTNFSFDVVALKSDGSIEDNYIAAGGDPKSVTVQLFDDSASPTPECSAYALPVDSKTLTYVSGDGGRKTLTSNFNINRAYGKLRCRVTDANPSPTVYGCSTDTFTVRPQSFSSVTATGSANADGTGASTSATPAIKAGVSFSLTANSGKIGYNGLPKIDANKTEWPGVPSGGRATPGVGTVGGSFATAANAATGNSASGNGFTYNEVGYFRFQPQGVYDDTFASASSDIANSDCTGDFSNTPVGGKYGCKFGNTAATNHFGRFIPDRFVASVTGGSAACATGGFSYMDQPFATVLNMTVEARNSSNVLTQNYSGSGTNKFANGVVGIQMENNNNGTAIPVARLNVTNTPAWSGGSYSVKADSFLRPPLPTLPLLPQADGAFDALDIGLSVSDEPALLPATSRPYLMTRNMDASNAACTIDLTGLSTAAGVCTAMKLVSAAKVRFGRLRLIPGQASDVAPFIMKTEAQYWDGAYWRTNTLDSCTSYVKENVACTGTASTSASATMDLNKGYGSITLAKPSGAGSARICLDMASTADDCTGATSAASLDYLRGNWGAPTYDKDPFGNIEFGRTNLNTRGNWGFIYRRENF